MELSATPQYSDWLNDLRDETARDRILIRVRRLLLGLPGNTKPVGQGVSELRIDYGPGYRVYYVQRRGKVIILLAGGNKSTQSRDIKLALKLAKEY